MRKVNLDDCTRANLEENFGLRKSLQSPILDSWLQTEVALSEHEKAILEVYQSQFILNGDTWNAHELLMFFIGPLLSMVNFTERYRFKLFSQRRISAIVQGLHEEIELGGIPDGIIATGFWEPKIPMFAFSEYKRELEAKNDPAGQALGAMLIGQTLNEREIPIYGCYVVGHDWYFLVLEGRHYTISRDFSANTDEIFEILSILKALKLIILEMTEPE